MSIKKIDVEKIFPVYHKQEKSRHDILCENLSKKSELSCYTENQISEVILYIEKIVSDSVEIAQDHLYGLITEDCAKEYIRKKSISEKDEVVDIIFERASYYARR